MDIILILMNLNQLDTMTALQTLLVNMNYSSLMRIQKNGNVFQRYLETAKGKNTIVLIDIIGGQQ